MDNQISFDGRKYIEVSKCIICNKIFKITGKEMAHNLGFSMFLNLKLAVFRNESLTGSFEACGDCIKVFSHHANELLKDLRERNENQHNEILVIRE